MISCCIGVCHIYQPPPPCYEDGRQGLRVLLGHRRGHRQVPQDLHEDHLHGDHQDHQDHRGLQDLRGRRNHQDHRDLLGDHRGDHPHEDRHGLRGLLGDHQDLREDHPHDLRGLPGDRQDLRGDRGGG
ncbi:hypothetical protein N7507_008906 [Penicillium longicatenatum]|nr:hypothetical protein N7507_008906 [Penicillium longicatenatum]